MPAGLEVFHDSGSLMLSHNIANPVLRTKTTINVSGGQLIVPYTRISASYSPVIALRSTAGGLGWLGMDDYTALAQNHYYLTPLADGSPVDVYIFDLPPPPSGNVGMEVYDAAGSLTFSVQNKPLRTRDLFTGNIVIPSEDRVLDSGRIYAAAPVQWTVSAIYRSQPDQTDHRLAIYQAIADGMRQSNFVFQSTVGDSAALDTRLQRQCLIVDVTGY